MGNFVYPEHPTIYRPKEDSQPQVRAMGWGVIPPGVIFEYSQMDIVYIRLFGGSKPASKNNLKVSTYAMVRRKRK